MKLETKAMQIEIKRYETLVFGKVKEVNEKLLKGNYPFTFYKNDITDFRVLLQHHIETYSTKWSLNIGVRNDKVCDNVFSFNFDTPKEAEDFYKSVITAVLELEEEYDF